MQKLAPPECSCLSVFILAHPSNAPVLMMLKMNQRTEATTW